MTVIDEKEIEQDEVVSLCHHQIEKITHRANELKMRYPEASDLFESYITSQKAECKDLTNEIIGVTFLLQSK
ncbi:MAG: hypothetical protein JJU16_04760 [Alkalibacterium sp.]|nr:hypothetical protein [Alkalibacterium sp.]